MYISTRQENSLCTSSRSVTPLNHDSPIDTLDSSSVYFKMSPNNIHDVEAADHSKGSSKFQNHFLPSSYRNALVVVVGEFCGTFMFLLLAFIGAQTAINNNDRGGDPDAPLLPMSLLYIAAAFGTALTVNIWIFYRVTGGMFNPAVSANPHLHVLCYERMLT